MRALVDDLHELAGAGVGEQVAGPHPLDGQRVDVPVGDGVRVQRAGPVRRLDERFSSSPAGGSCARGDAAGSGRPCRPSGARPAACRSSRRRGRRRGGRRARRRTPSRRWRPGHPRGCGRPAGRPCTSRRPTRARSPTGYRMIGISVRNRLVTTTRPRTPGRVIGRSVSSSRISTIVRSGTASCTRTSSPGTGVPTMPASTVAYPSEAIAASGKALCSNGRTSSKSRSPAKSSSSIESAFEPALEHGLGDRRPASSACPRAR